MMFVLWSSPSWPHWRLYTLLGYNKCPSVAEMGDYLATIDMDQKEGAAVPLSGGGSWVPVTQCGLGRGLLPYQAVSWSSQPFGHNRHGPKIGGCAPLWESSVARSCLQTVAQKYLLKISSNVLRFRLNVCWASFLQSVTHQSVACYRYGGGRTMMCRWFVVVRCVVRPPSRVKRLVDRERHRTNCGH